MTRRVMPLLLLALEAVEVTVFPRLSESQWKRLWAVATQWLLWSKTACGRGCGLCSTEVGVKG